MTIGFVSPEGDFIMCGYTEHSKKAEEILSSLNIESVNPEGDIANLGWMFLQINYAGIPSNKEGVLLTDKQVEWILKNYDNLNHKQKYFISETLKKDEEKKKHKYPAYLTEVNWSGLI